MFLNTHFHEVYLSTVPLRQSLQHHYRYTADVFDTMEMVPWIRTFLSRITRMNFSNRTIEKKFKSDIQEMYRMYGIDGGGAHDIQ